MKNNNINFTARQTSEIRRIVIRRFGKSTKRITKKRMKRIVLEVIDVTAKGLKVKGQPE